MHFLPFFPTYKNTSRYSCLKELLESRSCLQDISFLSLVFNTLNSLRNQFKSGERRGFSEGNWKEDFPQSKNQVFLAQREVVLCPPSVSSQKVIKPQRNNFVVSSLCFFSVRTKTKPSSYICSALLGILTTNY